jgi:predicted  nucleic acid-binding Zn-ribbon protein
MLALLCCAAIHGAAQTENIKTLRIQYSGLYQMEDSYTIIYDNSAETAKLNRFQIIFYGPDQRPIAETQPLSFPIDGKIETYQLAAPVVGFSEVGFSVLSLHSGEMANFTSEVGGILALNEASEVPDPAPAQTDIASQNDVNSEPLEPPESSAAPAVTTLSDDEITQIAHAEAELNDSLNSLQRLRADNRLRDELASLLKDISDLSQEAQQAKQTDIQMQLNALREKIRSEDSALKSSEKQNALDKLETDIIALQSQLQALVGASEDTEGLSEADIEGLAGLDTNIAKLNARLTSLEAANVTRANAIEHWRARFVTLKTQFKLATSPTPSWIKLLAILVAASLLFGVGLKTFLTGKAKIKPLKSTLNLPESVGVIFPASPMLAGNVAAPLAPAGQLAAAQLQMLSGPYAALKDAYQATGRMGYAQDGVPTKEDYSFGTGFLVSNCHVITNRHVHGLYGHYLLDKSDPGGIEFIAEKGKDASDFVPFNGEPPLLLPALDIAIYTLARPVTHRKPITLHPVETDRLNEQEIVVIGYPDTHTPDKAEVRAVVEDDPIFAVKRISQGRIFRHSTDTQDPFGVETPVSESNVSEFLMPAICHNASTMGGNSGSPLLDIHTGRLVGVHFAGFKVFNQEEAANLAMAIAQLTQSEALKNLPAVTHITTQADNIS